MRGRGQSVRNEFQFYFVLHRRGRQTAGSRIPEARRFPMPPRRNPLKLNKLQLRTLALAQVLAREPGIAERDEATGEVTLHRLPEPHGDHVHIGAFVVSGREASGLRNQAVWAALTRKGLARADAGLAVTLTAPGLAYDTGFGERFAADRPPSRTPPEKEEDHG